MDKFLFLLSENTLLGIPSLGIPSSILFLFGLLLLVLFSTQILAFFETSIDSLKSLWLKRRLEPDAIEDDQHSIRFNADTLENLKVLFIH